MLSICHKEVNNVLIFMYLMLVIIFRRRKQGNKLNATRNMTRYIDPTCKQLRKSSSTLLYAVFWITAGDAFD